MRVVIIRTSALGDTVLATPLARELARTHGVGVEWVTSPAYAPLLEGLPFVERVWPWERGRSAAALASDLRAAGPIHHAIDLQNKVATHLLLRGLRARRTSRFVKRKGVGAALASLVGEGPVLDEAHAASMYLDALPAQGLALLDPTPQVAVRPDALERAHALEAAAGKPLVALAPGARWALKRWPPERFAAVGDALAAQGAALLLVGGPDDGAELDALRSHLATAPVADTAAMGLADLAACLSVSALLVSGDSGPVHLAQGVGTPVVSIFGPTSARRWGPVPGAGAVVALPLPCAPCSNYGKGSCAEGDRACLEALPASAVIEVAAAALAAGRAGGAEAAERAASRAKLGLAVAVSKMARPWAGGGAI